MARFLEQLRPLSLGIRNPASDGNCLFRAIADQLRGRECEHKSIREQIVNYMHRHGIRTAPRKWHANSSAQRLRGVITEAIRRRCNALRKSPIWKFSNASPSRRRSLRWKKIHTTPKSRKRNRRLQNRNENGNDVAERNRRLKRNRLRRQSRKRRFVRRNPRRRSRNVWRRS